MIRAAKRRKESKELIKKYGNIVRTADLGEWSGGSTLILLRRARGDENGEDQPPCVQTKLAGKPESEFPGNFYFLLTISPLSPSAAHWDVWNDIAE